VPLYAVNSFLYIARNSLTSLAFVQGEMGKCEENRELYRQRSPISWATHLRVPLFLTHGGNDNRVPFSEGQRFAKRLQESGCPVEFYELPGEGHIYQYFDTQSAMYQKESDFLFRVCPIIYP
jgi:dipeptidyl aminopeptidase/acylaminoacyl peptidase